MGRSNQRLEQLESWLADGFRETDKLIVTVSSGLLAVSVPFLHQLQNLLALQYLILTWVLLVAAIAFVLVSLFFEKLNLIFRIKKILNDQREGGLNWRNHLISLFNSLSFLAFLLGVICLTGFLIQNLQTGS